MIDKYLGSGLPTLITLTGENPELMGRFNFKKAFKKVVRYHPAAIAARSYRRFPLKLFGDQEYYGIDAARINAILSNPNVPAFVKAKIRQMALSSKPVGAAMTPPSRIETVQPQTPEPAAPATIQTTSPESTDFSPAQESAEPAAMEPESMEGDFTKNAIFLLAGAGLIYFLVKKKVIKV